MNEEGFTVEEGFTILEVRRDFEYISRTTYRVLYKMPYNPDALAWTIDDVPEVTDILGAIVRFTKEWDDPDHYHYKTNLIARRRLAREYFESNDAMDYDPWAG